MPKQPQTIREGALKGPAKDSMRYANKLMLDSFTIQYLDKINQMTIPLDITEEERQRQIEDGAKIKRILNMVHEYATLDVTAIQHAELDKEIHLYEDILRDLNELEDKLADQEAKGLSTSENYDDFHRMTAGLLTYFEGQRDGCLEIVRDPKADKKEINTSTRKEASPDDPPLFPHDPSYNDIFQGSVGDCYLISSLSQVAIKHPEKIKEAIKDNGNGTVTVRFWERNMGKGGPGVGDTFKPVYVTVDKTVESKQSKNCLWVQMVEKAYRDSGFHLAKKPTMSGVSKYGEAIPSPDEMKEKYEEFSKMKRFELPSHAENPWLIDEKGNLRKFSPSYKDIHGGVPGDFAECFLGQEYQAECFLTNDLTLSSQTLSAQEMAYEFLFSNVMPDAHLDPYSYSRMKREFNSSQISTSDLIYRMVTNDPEAKLPKNDAREILISTPEMAIAVALDSAFRETLKEKFPAEGSSEYPKWDITGTSALVNRVRNGESIEPFASILSYYVDSNPDTQVRFNAWLEQFENKTAAFSNDYRVTEPHSGDYNGVEMKMWEKIRASLQSGQPVTVTTTKDTPLIQGLHSLHAYTVTGVEIRQNKKGDDLYFLRVRNPQGLYCRDYFKNKDGNWQAAFTENANGEGVIELGDAFKDLNRIMFNRPLEIKPAPADAMNSIEPGTLSKYYRALESLKEDLNAGTIFSRNSKEYKTLVKSIDNFMSSEIYHLKGREMTELPKAMEKINSCVDLYVAHCNETESQTKKSEVRRTRLKACASFKKLFSIAQTGAKDPRKAIMEEMAQGLVSSAILEEKLEPNQRQNLYSNRDVIAQKMENDTKFNRTYGRQPFTVLVEAEARIQARLKDLQLKPAQKQIAEQRSL